MAGRNTLPGVTPLQWPNWGNSIAWGGIGDYLADDGYGDRKIATGPSDKGTSTKKIIFLGPIPIAVLSVLGHSEHLFQDICFNLIIF